MKLIKNSFGGSREITSFSKEEILEIRSKLVKFKEIKADQEKINDFLEEKFPYSQLFENYALYLSNIEAVKEQLLGKSLEQAGRLMMFYQFKSDILNEIKGIYKNLHGLSLNLQNTKRFLKQNSFLETSLISIKNLTDKSMNLISELQKITIPPKKNYENESYLWIEINQVRNPGLKIAKIPSILGSWEEIKEFGAYIVNLDKTPPKKKKKKEFDSCYFMDIHAFFSDKYKDNVEFYMTLVHLLLYLKIFEEIEEEFVNVVEKKEIKQKMKNIFRPTITELIKDNLKDISDEIGDLIKLHHVGDDSQIIDMNVLLDQKISIFLPKIIDLYFNGLEKKYQSVLNDVNDLEEFKNIIRSYATKIDILSSKLDDIDIQIQKFGNLLKPYHHMTESLTKIIHNIMFEIARRKNEYEIYLKTVKKERLRDNIQNFVLEKIKELNDQINKYQDETSIIIREEFPQLKQIRKILNDYKEKINRIKDEVFKKLDLFKAKDVDLYNIIRQWEDNFHKKQQQLGFLLSLMLNKIFKNFKALVEEEETLFDSIAEITDNSLDTNEIPLNFALSDILADKMTIDELKERVSELQAKISKNETITDLYKHELNKIEEILATRIKIKEGIVDSTVKCTVCHEFIKFGKENIIKCPFCESTYHYLCVAFWLSKYNSCPTCQNVFLDPNSELFDIQEEP